MSSLESDTPDDATRLADRLHSFAIRLLRRARAADKASGLSPERLSALSVLVFVGPQTVSTLAEMESVSLPAISRTARGLEAEGLVARTRAQGDQRQVRLSATTKARRLVMAGRARRVAAVAAALKSLSPDEIAALETAAVAMAKFGDR
jgi:DNA-binding MarR family transcriptional regulator